MATACTFFFVASWGGNYRTRSCATLKAANPVGRAEEPSARFRLLCLTYWALALTVVICLIETLWENITPQSASVLLFGAFITSILASRLNETRRLQALGGARAPSLNYSWPFGKHASQSYLSSLPRTPSLQLPFESLHAPLLPSTK